MPAVFLDIFALLSREQNKEGIPAEASPRLPKKKKVKDLMFYNFFEVFNLCSSHWTFLQGLFPISRNSVYLEWNSAICPLNQLHIFISQSFELKKKERKHESTGSPPLVGRLTLPLQSLVLVPGVSGVRGQPCWGLLVA